MGRGRELLGKLLLAGFVSLGTVGLLEAALWIFHPTPWTEWMRWRPDGHVKGKPVPGSSTATAEGYEVRINSLGYRGPEPAWHPEPGTLRVLVFGGSAAFDFHASSEEATWPQRLAHHLREGLGQPVEVVNLALPGFSSVESKIHYLTTGRELHGHVAILYHGWNDMKFLRKIDRDPRVLAFAGVAQNRALWEEALRASQIGRLALNAYLRFEDRRRENFYTSLEDEGSGANLPPGEAGYAWAKRNFTDFARFARADGVLPVLVSQATLAVTASLDVEEHRVLIHNDFVGMTLPVLVDSFLRMRALTEAAARGEGAVYVDGYAAVPATLEHFRDHVHMHDAGLERLGGAVAEALLASAEFRALARRVAEADGGRAR